MTRSAVFRSPATARRSFRRFLKLPVALALSTAATARDACRVNEAGIRSLRHSSGGRLLNVQLIASKPADGQAGSVVDVVDEVVLVSVVVGATVVLVVVDVDVVVVIGAHAHGSARPALVHSSPSGQLPGHTGYGPPQGSSVLLVVDEVVPVVGGSVEVAVIEVDDPMVVVVIVLVVAAMELVVVLVQPCAAEWVHPDSGAHASVVQGLASSQLRDSPPQEPSGWQNFTTVQMEPSSHGAPAGRPTQPPGSQRATGVPTMLPRDTVRSPGASQSTGILKTSIEGVTWCTSAEYVSPSIITVTPFPLVGSAAFRARTLEFSPLHGSSGMPGGEHAAPSIALNGPPYARTRSPARGRGGEIAVTTGGVP